MATIDKEILREMLKENNLTNVNDLHNYLKDLFNIRAKKCYEKCGIEVEGILKDEIFKYGKYYDEIIMSAFNI